MSGLSILTRNGDPDPFEAAAAPLRGADDRDEFDHGPYGRRYHPLALGDRYRDRAFAVTESGRPIALFECGCLGGTYSYFGMPIRPRFAEGLGARQLAAALAAFRDHLAGHAVKDGAAGALIEGGAPAGVLPPLGVRLSALDAIPKVVLHAVVDLGRSPDAIRRGVRERYRSMINWGRANLTLRYVNAAAPDRALFDSYQAFHARIAGRVTRPQDSWDAMFDALASGAGELALGYDSGGTLLCGVMALEGERIAHYASGVYERDAFDRPLGHWPLFNAILRAKERGRALFDVGRIPPPDEPDAKVRGIGRFKRGFSDRIEAAMVWTLPLAAAEEPE